MPNPSQPKQPRPKTATGTDRAAKGPPPPPKGNSRNLKHGANAKHPPADLVAQFTELARVVDGPWAGPLSALAGQPLRLVEPGPERPAVDRGTGGGVSLISSSTLAALAQRAGVDEVDSRRFRMLVEVAGTGPHEEDQWVGRRLRLGTAVIRLTGHVGRCLVTSRDPDTGESDLPVLDILAAYRRDVGTSEPLALGVYGAVRQPGIVRVGDPVELLNR